MAAKRLTRSLQDIIYYRAQKEHPEPTPVERLEKEILDELKRAKSCKSIEEICEIFNERLTKLTTDVTDCHEELEAASKFLKQKCVCICVAGQQNSGKSTLLNSLLGDMYLPQSSMSTTSIKVHIRHHPNVHTGYCSGEGCKNKTTGVNAQKALCPKLIIKSSDGERCETGSKRINQALKELNAKCRQTSHVCNVEVVLEVHIPLLAAQNIEKGWSLNLVDNPGFGESNEYIQQIADASILISAAYILVTNTDNMDSKATTAFLNKLSEKDKDAFRDGRVLVGITKFDNTYQVPFGEERITEEWACTTMCKIIEKAASQPLSQLKAAVLPISGIWALSSVMLRDINEDRFPQEFKERKQQVQQYLNNFPEVMQGLEGGQGENASLSMMGPLKMAEVLLNASHVEMFTERLQGIAERCVHTWRQKVYSVYMGIAETKRKKIGLSLADKSQEVKRRKKRLDYKEERYASIMRELRDIKETTTGHKTLSIRKKIDEAFDRDIETQLDKLKQCAKNELENLISEFQKKCEENILSPTKFGPSEFKQEFSDFLKVCEATLEEKLNERCIFSYVIDTIKDSCGIIGERIGALKTDTNRLCNSRDSRVTIGSYATTERPAQRPLSPPSLGDLKSAVGSKIPHLRLSVWDHIVLLISKLFGVKSTERGTPIEELRLSDLVELFTALPDMTWERCEHHFKNLKSAAVKHFYEQDYCLFVTARLNRFHFDFKGMLDKETDKQRKESYEIKLLEDECATLSRNCEQVQKLESLLFNYKQ